MSLKREKAALSGFPFQAQAIRKVPVPDPYVLIVGPEVETRQRLADILARTPYEVGRCRWEQLAAELQARFPDLLVLLEEAGVVQPFIRHLKADDATWDLPIIVALTEFSDTAAAWALEVGADEFLLPPFEPREVLARVAVVLRLQHDRRLLLASHEEFSRIFKETVHPLFFCDRWGSVCNLNPSLRRLLGYPGKRGTPVPVPLEELLYAAEDRERFRRILTQPGEARHVKLHLVNREGQPVTVLINDLALGPPPGGRELPGAAGGFPLPPQAGPPGAGGAPAPQRPGLPGPAADDSPLGGPL